MNQFGISEKSYTLLLQAFAKFPQVEQVAIFGSRARGNYKKGSDIDLAIKGTDCTAQLALDIMAYLNEELPIPYMVDIIDYGSLQHPELREHIDRVGMLFYSRASHLI